MGYYVQINKSTATIPAANKATVLAIWKALNAPENNHLKRGGSYSGGGKQAYWFSWMPEDYDQTMNSVEEILDALGFEFTVHDNGDITLDYYDNKMGQEDLFLERASNYMTGMIRWVGEDAEIWETEFTGDNVIDGELVQETKLLTNS